MHRFALLCLLLSPSLVRADGFDPTSLDEPIESIRKELQVPGAAVVVVRDDKILYLKGFGVRELGKADVVSAETVFPIASCSKAFTATLIAMLADEGKLSWDDRVREHLDTFRLSDELADRDVTLRDLLSHRTGMPRHDLLLFGQDFETPDVIRRWGKARASTSFRSTWEYSNVPFTTAGFIAGGYDNTDWATAVERRIFKPLKMTASSGTWKAGSSAADHTTPHYQGLDGKIQQMPWDQIDSSGGAGCINSTAKDMANWLRFQLAGGKLGDKRLIGDAALKETHRPQMLVKPDVYFTPFFPPHVTKFTNYGLGWFVQDYRGRMVVSHGGTLSGIRAQCMLVPEKNLGVFAVCNLRPSYFPETVCRTVIDRILESPTEDWVKFAKDKMIEVDAKIVDANMKRVETKKPDAKLSLPLKDYTGTYTERAYGKAEVSVDGEALKVTWGKITFRMEHHNHDTFVGTLTAPESLARTADRAAYEAQFRLGSRGEVLVFNLFGQDFVKMPEKK